MRASRRREEISSPPDARSHRFYATRRRREATYLAGLLASENLLALQVAEHDPAEQHRGLAVGVPPPHRTSAPKVPELRATARLTHPKIFRVTWEAKSAVGRRPAGQDGVSPWRAAKPLVDDATGQDRHRSVQVTGASAHPGEYPFAGEPRKVRFVTGARLPVEVEELFAFGQDEGVGVALPPGLVADRQLGLADPGTVCQSTDKTRAFRRSRRTRRRRALARVSVRATRADLPRDGQRRCLRR